MISLGVLLVVGLWVVATYNSLVKANLAVDTQWSKVEVQYQRRFDLIPNLVASVQGSMKQERDIFIAIAFARKGYANATTVDEKAQAAGRMESVFSRLLMVTENYPTLTSNENIKGLMVQLEGTENRVSVERSRYNDEVSNYNGKIITFPANLIAGMFGFHPRTFFKADQEAAKAPAVKLN